MQFAIEHVIHWSVYPSPPAGAHNDPLVAVKIPPAHVRFPLTPSVLLLRSPFFSFLLIVATLTFSLLAASSIPTTLPILVTMTC